MTLRAPTAPSVRRTAVAGLLTLLAVVGATALPQVRDDRGAEPAMRAQLQRVAQAQEAWRAERGAYTTRLEDLRIGSGGDLAIVRADAAGFCVGAHDDGTGASLFYSAPGGLWAGACAGAAPDG